MAKAITGGTCSGDTGSHVKHVMHAICWRERGFVTDLSEHEGVWMTNTQPSKIDSLLNDGRRGAAIVNCCALVLYRRLLMPVGDVNNRARSCMRWRMG